MLPGCDSSLISPVAPERTLFSISAHPALIAPFATSIIEVRALHPTGVPIREGTEISFSAEMGSIDAVATTDEDGIARATFRSDGRAGMARITATSGAEGQDGTISTEVEVRDTNLVASFSATASGLTVDFQDTSTSTGGPPTTWEWRFGDGATSGERNPEHTYQQAGTYTVRLTVSNPEGSDTASRPLGVSGALARFSYSASNLVVSFTDESDPPPLTLEWRFGDGTTSNLANPVHTYGRGGSFTVRLTITTPSAGSASTSEVVIVEDEAVEPPVANFTIDSNALTVIFNDASTGSPTNWAWAFGDGGTSAQQDPVHTYATAGTYAVSLTARNGGGEDTFSMFVTVTDP